MSDELDIAVYIVSALPTPPTGMLMSAAFSAACRIFGVRAVDDVAHGPGFTVLLTVTSPEPARGPDAHAAVDSLSRLIASELRARGGSCIVDVASLGTVSGTGPAREAVEHWVEHLSAATTVSSPSAAYRERLEDMLRTHAIKTLFQPIVEAASGRVVAYESLSRGSLGAPAVSAPELFEAARQSGLEEVVCAEMSRLAVQRARHLLPDDALLFVNVAPDERWQGPWLGIDLAGEASAWPAHRTVLELTERSPINDVQAFVHKRERARASGVRFALDDAGAGYAGLATLAILAPEYIKVDIGLVQNCSLDGLKRSVIDALVYLAGEIGARVIAEGVEAVPDLETVRDLGVDLVQGHLVAEPAETPPVVPRPWPHGITDDGVGVHATGRAARRRRASHPHRH